MAKKIFIIDDDRDMVDALTLVLEKHGYAVDSTLEARGAVEKARQAKPDAIILDVMFPEDPSQGFELARELHGDEAVGKIPVLILSAVNDRSKLGFSDQDRDEDWLPVFRFIEKPVSPAKLVAHVREALK
ncbi:MAG: response regulator [Elusimicrobiota bacterium]|jgi:DNA-binding response OmpR family regulator